MGNATSTKALSGFWSQFFHDIGDIDALFQGSEELGSQLYADTLDAVLGRSLRDTPLYRRELAKAVPVRASQISRDPTDSTRRRIPVPAGWRRVRYVQDSLVAPRTILDAYTDFVVGASYVSFKNDPRYSLAESARTAVPVTTSAVLVTDQARRVVAGDTLAIDGIAYVVKYANTHDVGLLESYKFPATDKAVSWQLVGSSGAYSGRLLAGPATQGSEEVYTLWAIDIDVDDYALYNNFGYVFTGTGYEPPTPTPSSEAYKNFLTGVYKLRTGGPTPNNIKSAATAVAGLPLVMFPDERVSEITTDATSRRVITDRRAYTMPLAAPLADEVVVGGLLTQYAPLAAVVEVLDHTTHPYWWYGREVPKKFLPSFTTDLVAARTATDNIVSNTIADDLNVIGQAAKVDGAYANRAGYVAMSVLLKYQSFGVKLHPSIAASEEKIRRLVLEARPADKYPYVWVA